MSKKDIPILAEKAIADACMVPDSPSKKMKKVIDK
jgi:hypothetical protein